MSRKRLRIIMLCALALAPGPGCSTTPELKNENRTAGLELQMLVEDEGGGVALYRLKQDGTLSFGGGMDARFDRTTWTGDMTGEEIAHLTQLIETHRWLERKPIETRVPPKRAYDISFKYSGQREHFKVKGASPDIQPIHDLLEQIALRRLHDDLERLPKPSSSQGG